jgi:hypothetical protein
LGEILAVLLADPTVGAEDKLWIAALCVRYELIPWKKPDAEIAPAVRAALAAVPPQPPPYWEGGMFPPAMQREMQYGWLQEAVAAGNWQGVQSLAEALAANLAIPEVAAAVRAELAARALDLAALLARSQAELARSDERH